MKFALKIFIFQSLFFLSNQGVCKGSVEYDEIQVIHNSPLDVESASFDKLELFIDESSSSDMTLEQIISNSPGVITRSSGELGSGYELYMNGLSGNQVRYFIDGVPLESLGSSVNLNEIPLNVINKIEIYKGVVPISLSSDALAGAINIVTKQIDQSYSSANSVLGSFGTQRLSAFNQNISKDEEYFYQISAAIDKSDNNYDITVDGLDDLGNITKKTKAKKFNNGYKSQALNLKLGLQNKKYADELYLNINTIKSRKQVQHPTSTINKVFGKYSSTKTSNIFSIKHKINRDSLFFNSYLSFGSSLQSYKDTFSRVYRWDEAFKERPRRLGELGQRSIFNVEDDFFRYQFFSKIMRNTNSHFEIALNGTEITRKGNDELNKNSKLYPFPNKIDKQIISLGYKDVFFKNLIHSNFFIKKYLYKANINNFDDQINFENSNISFDNLGYGASFKYSFTENLLANLSFEKTIRMPEPDEIMGDGQFVLPNPDLRSEISHNYNFGLSYSFNKFGSYHAFDGNAFIRDAKNFSRFFPVQVVRGRYLNLDAVDVKGVELSYTFESNNGYFANINATLQNIISSNKLDSDGQKNINYGSRIPNVPYRFFNARLAKNFDLDDSSSLRLGVNTNYVEEYFYNWENLGEKKSKFMIPEQFVHDFEVDYLFSHINLKTSFIIKNINDSRVFDNLNIEKPGRAYYFKLDYTL